MQIELPGIVSFPVSVALLQVNPEIAAAIKKELAALRDRQKPADPKASHGAALTVASKNYKK